MPNSTIWVLIANEKIASISASKDGISTLLQTYNNAGSSYRSGPQSRDRFASILMAELSRGALNRAYGGGLIILTDPTMANELQAIMPMPVARLLIAELPAPSFVAPQLGDGIAPALCA